MTTSSLWYTRCPVPTASGIAQHKRWLHGAFEEVGVRLDSIRASPDRAVRESHFRHGLAGSFREGGNVPPIWARSQGQDTVVVAITWVDEAQLVLVRPDSDIRSVADLRGRRLGLGLKDGDLVDVLRAESLRGLLTALEINGVGRDEVDWVDLPAPEWDLRERESRERPPRHLLVDAVLTGEVDAVFVKGAGSTRALDDLRPIFDVNQQQDPMLRISAGSPRPVTVDRTTLESSPDLVDRYLAVLLRTAEWARGNPDDVVATIASETGTSRAAVRRAFGPTLHLAFEPRLDDVVVQALRRQKDFLLDEGFLHGDVDVDRWIDPAPLERAHVLAPWIELAAPSLVG